MRARLCPCRCIPCWELKVKQGCIRDPSGILRRRSKSHSVDRIVGSIIDDVWLEHISWCIIKDRAAALVFRAIVKNWSIEWWKRGIAQWLHYNNWIKKIWLLVIFRDTIVRWQGEERLVHWPKLKVVTDNKAQNNLNPRLLGVLEVDKKRGGPTHSTVFVNISQLSPMHGGWSCSHFERLSLR